MQKETKLEEILRLTLESLQKQEYSTETLLRYQKKFNALNSFAHSRGISEPSDGLFQEYLSDNKNKYTGEYSVFKDRQRIRVVNLIKSYITIPKGFSLVSNLYCGNVNKSPDECTT